MRRIGALIVALFALAVNASAQTYTVTPTPFQTALNNSGVIINNACVWTYTAGTSTPATTYNDNTGTMNTNPIRSNSAGRFTAYLIPGNSYKFVYEASCTPPAHATVLRTADNIAAVPAASGNTDIAGTAGETLTAGLLVYLSDGSGSKNAGQWYKADSTNTYSSTLPEIGFSTAAISSGSAGTIRLAGLMTGLSSLTPGSEYYASTTGTITSTAPTNGRHVGHADTPTSLVLSADPPPLHAGTGITISAGAITSTVTPNQMLGCGIRLTLTSGTPVTTADVTAASTIYAEPFSSSGWGAGACAFYDGSATWTTLTFTSTSIALGTLTAALPYDVFCYNNSGTMACDAPLAWTNTTTRATALTTQNGVLVKTGATTRRYIGTFYTTATTTTEDSVLKRDLYNYYNAIERPFLMTDATATWNYTTATWRQMRATATNQVETVIGWAERPVFVQVFSSAANGTLAAIGVGIGEDSTSVVATGCLPGHTTIASGNVSYAAQVVSTCTKIPAVGYHKYVPLEISQAVGTTAWFGTGTDALSVPYVSGLTGWTKN